MKSQRLAFAAAISVCWFLTPELGLGGVIRHDRSEAIYRNLAASSDFAAVGRVNWNEPGGSFLGSGTLISPEWVLTAGHVVEGTNRAGAGISSMRFLLGGTSVLASEWTPHPQWGLTGGSLSAGWDLGLVRLSDPITSAPPATLYTGTEELGQVATLVGYGATGTGLTGATGGSGAKRAGENTVDVVGATQTPGSNSGFRFSHDRLLTVDFDRPGEPSESTLGSNLPLDREYLIASGDSGGGLFLDIDGQTLLAGVTSFSSSTDANGANADYGDRGSFVRVSSFIDWIESTTGLDLTGGSDPTGPTDPVDPPDGPIVNPVPGDYSGDGLVTQRDYNQWRVRYGWDGPPILEDGNRDGVVDAADYTVWRDALSAAGTNRTLVARVVAVPEPSSLVILIGASGAVLVVRRTGRNRR